MENQVSHHMGHVMEKQIFHHMATAEKKPQPKAAYLY